MATAKEFVEFWLENSVHADEQYGLRRGREELQVLVDKLVAAGKDQSFAKEHIEAEIGDIFEFIKSNIDSKNEGETSRLKGDKK